MVRLAFRGVFRVIRLSSTQTIIQLRLTLTTVFDYLLCKRQLIHSSIHLLIYSFIHSYILTPRRRCRRAHTRPQ